MILLGSAFVYSILLLIPINLMGEIPGFPEFVVKPDGEITPGLSLWSVIVAWLGLKCGEWGERDRDR